MREPALDGHARVLIDTAVWIYHLEANARFATVAGNIIAGLEAGRFRGVASELTLHELIVRPLQLGRQDVADEYELLMSHFPHLEWVPVTGNILVRAAALRARHRLRGPAAIQIATALESGATLAVTGADTWRQLPEIATLIITDGAGS